MKKIWIMMMLLTSSISVMGCASTDNTYEMYNTEIVSADEILESSDKTEEIREESSNNEIADNQPVDSNEEIEDKLSEYVVKYNAEAYYSDLYLESMFLLIGDKEIVSLFIMDDFIKCESILYQNIARVETNIVGEIGFVKVFDKNGTELSFTFNSDAVDEITGMINERAKGAEVQ